MLELQDIFREYEGAYKKKYYISNEQAKAIRSIKNCRTSYFGSHVEICDTCREIKVSYNSCRNRSCPKCQGMAREKWIYNKEQDILPIKYFHIVFTIPEELYNLCYMNQREMYSLLFRASSETILELSKDKKYIGAQVGFLSVLHTWGQNLMYHPHIHCIVTGGGLSYGKNTWKNSKKDFFIPVKVMGKMFRGKFLSFLKEAYERRNLVLEGKCNSFKNEDNFKRFMSGLFNKNWVVYCKKPFQDASYVIKYLGRYTHRIAISNNRIIKLEDGKVTFKWKDYRDDNKNKIMTVDATEFMRRFLLHVLPKGFVKLRSYGILSNRNRNLKLTHCKRIFDMKILKEQRQINMAELFRLLTGRAIDACPKCKHGKLVPLHRFHPKNDKPPGDMQNEKVY